MNRNGMRLKLLAGSAVLILLTAGCSSDSPGDEVSPSASPLPASVGEGAYAPQIDAANFVDVIDNPYMPLTRGKVLSYVGFSEEGRQREVFMVTYGVKEILGVTTTVVHDKVYSRGQLVEDTFDWFAQDLDGNVWYFGEASRDIEDGKIVSRHGSWEAGVDGAQPGIIMPGEPEVGQHYRQEFYEAEAEDTARVLRLDASVTVGEETYDNVLVTEDRNPLEPNFVEHKFYAPGVGVVKERLVQGGDEELELRKVDHIDPPRFTSIDEAVDFIQSKMDIPVVLPAKLPRGAHLSIYDPVDVGRSKGRPDARLRIDFGLESYLIISYGHASFDGCPDPMPVDILGQPGMVQEHQTGATVVWPVRQGSLEGRYGLNSDILSADRLIRMAESMERARAETKKEEFPGC